ncbi:arrestin domain-containing protein 3-like [Oppia nitens]|uniref:arrestin domain-containing protein 3-like n=1 Tax=Oppia nitens TaxID=1686743 RepID=UPI0023D9949C|nr:arrestin domain-containing protein 3-like [Oppia nitens]
MGKLKSFEIVLESDQNVYYPGQHVKGKCAIELRSELKLKSIKIYMVGIAKVHWTESRSTGNRLGAYTEHYSSEIEYFFKKQLLCGPESNDSREVLIEGHHEFVFSFQLPNGGISTSFEGKYGNIRYWLKAEVEKPWGFNHKTKKAFTVITPIDINRREYLIPVENSIEKSLCCLCCTSGPIHLYARTDRTGYCPGESISITAEFENHSRRTVIPHATLYQSQTFLAGGKSRCRRFKFTIVTGLAIQPRRTANWDAQLLKIPAVSPSIINCSLIKVEYAVRITLQIPLIGYNLSVYLPIIVGTVPLRAQSSNSQLMRPSEVRMSFYPPVPSYSAALEFEEDISTTPPPTYAECISGSVDIGDDEDGDIIGDTRFTPMYAYVHNYSPAVPPPAYSEIDPHPNRPA